MKDMEKASVCILMAHFMMESGNSTKNREKES